MFVNEVVFGLDFSLVCRVRKKDGIKGILIVKFLGNKFKNFVIEDKFIVFW